MKTSPGQLSSKYIGPKIWSNISENLAFQKRSTGAEVRFHNSIIDIFMVYQDRIETNLLQLFGHPENSGWFSIIPVVIFEVNIIDGHKQTYDRVS